MPRELLDSVATRVGRELARLGIGLVAGNAPGVDRRVSAAYWDQCQRLGIDPESRFVQLHLPLCSRGALLPFPGFRHSAARVERLGRTDEWISRALDLADAVILINGKRGSLRLARRFIEAGIPVLPIPFVDGESRRTFEVLLADWSDLPVPGLRRSQFLKLAVPWKSSGTGPLRNLLLGILESEASVFISYRRSDTSDTSARIHDDLSDEFGVRRVFFDVEDIHPTQQWKASIETAVQQCSVGLVIIGRNYFVNDENGYPRISDTNDVVHREVKTMLDRRIRIIPVLVGGAGIEILNSLPTELMGLREFQAMIFDQKFWSESLTRLLTAINEVLVVPDVLRTRNLAQVEKNAD